MKAKLKIMESLYQLELIPVGELCHLIFTYYTVPLDINCICIVEGRFALWSATCSNSLYLLSLDGQVEQVFQFALSFKPRWTSRTGRGVAIPFHGRTSLPLLKIQ